MASNGTARDYVETYVQENDDVEEYLSSQQPRYDPNKGPTKTGSSQRQTQPEVARDQTQEPKSSYNLHQPTINPMPTSDTAVKADKPNIVWAVRDFLDQKREIHETALGNCADLHSDLLTCFKDGSWWDKAKMCEDQKQKFWNCYNQQKKFLKAANYKGPISTEEEDTRILYDAINLPVALVVRGAAVVKDHDDDYDHDDYDDYDDYDDEHDEDHHSKPTPTPTKTHRPTPTHSSISRDVYPVSSPAFLPSFPAPTFSVSDPVPTGTIERDSDFNIKNYPDTWKTPPTDDPDLDSAVAAIDFEHVPNIPVRKVKPNGDIDMDSYDMGDDQACWWSATGCTAPKLKYLPEDIVRCPRAGDWGLTFDDGPLNPKSKNMSDAYAEPRLYDYLAAHHNQKATLFFVGSNVATFPEAAKRALESGHELCLHTWSHTPMTTKTNEQVIAELYWNLRAIKEATGVTSRCWRPPYGDVDDRVRAIAHQMGLRTILWNKDSQDWQLNGEGKMSPETIDGYFTKWIEEHENGKDEDAGHIGLQHELNGHTIDVAEKWLPKMQKAFHLKPVHECMNLPKPYWEHADEEDSGHGYHHHDHEDDEEDDDDDDEEDD
ncbi:hypothetical protein EC973_007062 [Apophysomyces ossiformis]|uniref:NodB homology domain-containing protein n=1 Tax=Apophysomyces ossiformis TaxID=679940 RepID=A0A8H7EVE5_9FUNG|nr:hypothetical protein EC973_007062 [Apophysomyces ossiformis]